MKFENKFAVAAPVDEVWTALMDLERVAPCMPGAEVLERSGENAYKVGIKVKVGPISMLYRGNVEVVEQDDNTHTATMRARAREARGQGMADAHIRSSLVERGTGTEATMETELQLSGRAASMGRGVIVDVAQKLVETFAENLSQMLGAAPDAPHAPEAPHAPHAPHAPDAPEAPEAPSAGVEETRSSAGGAPAPPTPPPAAPPRPAPARAQESLPVGKIAHSVLHKRLEDPRTLVIATASVAFVSWAIGYAIGRSR